MFRLLVYTGVCFQHSQCTRTGFHTILWSTTGSISGFPSVRGTAGIVWLGECFTRICCSISSFDTLDILSTRSIWPSEFSSTAHILPLSTHSISAAGTTAILSVLAARNVLDTWYILECLNTLSTGSIQSTEPRCTASCTGSIRRSNRTTYCNIPGIPGTRVK